MSDGGLDERIKWITEPTNKTMEQQPTKEDLYQQRVFVSVSEIVKLFERKTSFATAQIISNTIESEPQATDIFIQESNNNIYIDNLVVETQDEPKTNLENSSNTTLSRFGFLQRYLHVNKFF